MNQWPLHVSLTDWEKDIRALVRYEQWTIYWQSYIHSCVSKSVYWAAGNPTRVQARETWGPSVAT